MNSKYCDVVLGFLATIMGMKAANKYLDVKKIDWELVDLKKNNLVLDVGAGNCIDAIRFALFGANVIALDVDANSLRRSQIYIRKELSNLQDKVGFVVADALYIPFKDRAFDSSVSFSVIEHLQNGHQKMIDELSRVTRIRGTVTVTTSSKLNLMLRLFRFPLPAGPYSEHRLFSPKELKDMMKNAGLKPKSFSGGIIYYWKYGPPLFAGSRFAFWLDTLLNKLENRLKIFNGRIGYKAVK